MVCRIGVQARPPALLATLALLFVLLLSSAAPAGAQSADPVEWRRGDTAFADTFSRNNGDWTVETGSDALRSIGRGRLTVRVPEEELFRWATLEAEESFSDFYVEVETSQLEGPTDGMAGIIFRYQDADNFYAFLADNEGWYALLAYVDGELDRLIDWGESNALESGDGATNLLSVLADGREITIYANEEPLDTVQDRSFADGQIALIAGTNKEGGLAVGFDNFGLWNKPAGAAVGRKSINRSSTPSAPSASNPPAQSANSPDAVVNTDTLNVRSGPGTNYPVVGALKNGDGVAVIGRSADSKWAKLGFSDVKEAWASAQYLRFNIQFGQVAVVTAPPAPTPRPQPRQQPPAANRNLAWLVIENHIGRYITVQVNDRNFRVEGKVGDTPGRYQFELQGVGRYRVAAQLPNGGGHNWDLYVEPTADKCAGRQGCIALGQTFLQTYY